MSAAMEPPGKISAAARARRYFIEKPSQREARRSVANRAAEVKRDNLALATPDQRRAALDNAIMTAIAHGAVVEHRRDFDAVLRYDRKINHVAHAILSLLSVGLWLFVWLVRAIYAKPVRVIVSVDEYGLAARSTTVA